MLKENIIKILREGQPMRVGELAEALKTDKKEVEKIVKELKKEEIIISPKRCYITIEK